MANTDNLITYVAHEAIGEFEVVSLRTDGKVSLPSAATDVKIVGVAQRTVAAGDTVEVLIHGITRVKAGLAIGNLATAPQLAAAADGEVTVAASGEYPIARALPNLNQVSTAGAGEQFFAYFIGAFTPLA